MKISDIKTTFLNLPHREPEFVSTGYRLGTTEILIEVETDEGIMGLGECICRPNSQVIEAAILSAKPFLLGRDPRNIERILNDLRSLGNWSFFERVGNVMMGGIETALWDIMGKVSGQPLYYLLGGLPSGAHSDLLLSSPLPPGRDGPEGQASGFRGLPDHLLQGRGRYERRHRRH